MRVSTHQLCQIAVRCPQCVCFVFVLILMQTANSLDHQWSTAAQMAWVPWPHLNHPLLVFLSVPIRKLRFRLSQVSFCSYWWYSNLLLGAGWVWGQSFFGFVFKNYANFLFWITSILTILPFFSFESCILRPASINFRWLLPHLNCLVLNWVGNLTNIPFKCPGLLCLRCLIKFSPVYDEMWKYSIMNFFIKSNILNLKDYFFLRFLSLFSFHGVFFVFKYWKQNV